uniref:Uncharacterized protein n=1 Tax=Rhizophora mucronata TaxID=61149 RepID=A0A2P2NWD3_RHIMU
MLTGCNSLLRSVWFVHSLWPKWSLVRLLLAFRGLSISRSL